MVGPQALKDQADAPERLAERVLDAARARGLRLAVAESDTGGLVLSWLTAVPGSSAVVLGGVVAYADALKHGLLGVEPELIAQHGAVSQAVAVAMAVGVKEASGADVGLASTGIAGPGGARPGKPVGLAWLAVAHGQGLALACGQRLVAREHHNHGGRQDNRRASGTALLALALEALENCCTLEQMC